ncbi:AbrB family transcriptional regulator [Corynebacterium sp. CNCTC7651]|uniref:AbrB family transcriptional regulator n=1 Tax=Corynebacterium sp. CNCTC7651 TaxID=2815361 RepID=UPI001F1A4B22|nr:AbrB family transcriptional regulator [Corynebacterium sp. CNCTC7651]
MNRWLVVVPLSVALGAGLSALHVPAAWILGAILASGGMALASGRELPLDDRIFRFARGIIGVMAALPLVGIPPRELLPFLLPGLIAAAFVLALAFGGGLVLANHGVTRETGVLSLLPGGASVMPAIAQEVGADVRYVSLSQYLRLLVVSMTLPLVASVMAPGVGGGGGSAGGVGAAVGADAAGGVGAGAASVATSAATGLAPGDTVSPWMWLLVPALVVVGLPVGKFLRLPNASVFGPMLVTVLVGSMADFQVASPRPLTIAGLIAIGWVCGGGLSVPALKQFKRLLPATLAYIALLMTACAAVGWLMSAWLGISFYEGYLATTPGALETVLALAAEGGAGPAVIALQLIRLICVLIFAGYLPKLLRHLSRG